MQYSLPIAKINKITKTASAIHLMLQRKKQSNTTVQIEIYLSRILSQETQLKSTG